jgi:hypothetical protein
MGSCVGKTKEICRRSLIEQQTAVYTWKSTMDMPVVRDADSGRIGSMIRWGRVPFWAKNLKKT